MAVNLDDPSGLEHYFSDPKFSTLHIGGPRLQVQRLGRTDLHALALSWGDLLPDHGADPKRDSAQKTPPFDAVLD
jgi:hypothetical protein